MHIRICVYIQLYIIYVCITYIHIHCSPYCFPPCRAFLTASALHSTHARRTLPKKLPNFFGREREKPGQRCYKYSSIR